VTNEEVKVLLRECYDRLTSVYPFPEGSDIDPRLAITIGFVAGAIVEGLAAEREDRKVWFHPTENASETFLNSGLRNGEKLGPQ
jgi:hypothetical protein